MAVNVTILLAVHSAAFVACVTLFVLVARRRGSAHFLTLCAAAAVIHLGDAVFFLGYLRSAAEVVTHVALTLLSPLLAMALGKNARALWVATGLALAAAFIVGVQFVPAPGIVLLAVTVAYLIIDRLVRQPAGVAARGIVASLILIEIFVVLMAAGVRPLFPRPEWWLQVIGQTSSIPLLLLLAVEREHLPLHDELIRRGVATMAVFFWIAAADRWLPQMVVAFVAVAVWQATSHFVRGRLVSQKLIAAGLESQRLLAQRMSERELIDGTCGLLRSALECDVEFDGTALRLGERRRVFSAGELRIIEGVCSQLVAAIEAEGRRRREYDMRELATRAELSALRAQIQPHFLFNVLNTLAELVRENPVAAEAMIEQLADVFRYALASTRRDLVPLGEEVDFVRAYLAIEQSRFESRLGIEMDVPEECRGVPIPPMTLQPLVENAIRHGVGRSVSGGTVSIAAKEHDHGVRISVADRSGDRSLADAGGEGIALGNVRARLQGLAGARLDVSAMADGTTVTIEVPVRC